MMIDRGQEDYEPYYYLWHLIAIGALKADDPVTESQICPVINEVVWDNPILSGSGRDVKVALIDMGIARQHPNLDQPTDTDSALPGQVLWESALDLASHRYGAKYDLEIGSGSEHVEERAQHLNSIRTDIITDPVLADGETTVLNNLKDSIGVRRYVRAYDQNYASHGTACAGLVCGTTFDTDLIGPEGKPILYYGVDPFSRIVPITTSISPDPEQLIAAFLYAHSLDVDVILVPRGASHPDYVPHFDKVDENELTRLDKSDDIDLKWNLLSKIIRAVSKDIPIVCAAGNDGNSHLIYPARLAGEENNGIIAVGAVSAKAYRAGYSNYGAGLTVVAPSDDGEVYNRHQIRLDMQSPDIKDFWIDDVHLHPAIPRVPFSAERLISVDIPGPRGYASGARREPTRDRGEAASDPSGLYTEFGGTSGASAIVAGVVALMQRKHIERQSGIDIKSMLIEDGPNLDVSHWYWLSGEEGSDLKSDGINGDSPNPVELFGAGGLVNIPRLLQIPSS